MNLIYFIFCLVAFHLAIYSLMTLYVWFVYWRREKKRYTLYDLLFSTKIKVDEHRHKNGLEEVFNEWRHLPFFNVFILFLLLVPLIAMTFKAMARFFDIIIGWTKNVTLGKDDDSDCAPLAEKGKEPENVNKRILV